MKKISIARFVSMGSILTSISIIFQSSPVFFPMFGLVLSPLSTLPIALASCYNISLGIAVYFSSILILTLVSMQEALILLFTTGLLGIVMGSLLYRKGIFVSILFSSIVLSLGIILMTYVLDISAFGNLTISKPISLTSLIYLLFSIIYSTIWNICLRKFINYLTRTKFFHD